MILGTPFIIESAPAAVARLRRRLARAKTTEETIRWLLARCEDGSAICLGCDDGSVMVGLRSEDGGTMDAQVLFAASVGGYGVFRRHEEEIAAIARDMGASTMSFKTSRLGWKRLLGPQWSAAGDCFRRSI